MSQQPPQKPSQAKRASFAAFMGSVLEYYDLVIYGTASALVFDRVFFPESSSALALILSFATFATGYLARPVGAIIFGYIGDRISRKTAILLTLAMMGAATVLMGVIPPYAAIGVAAPIILVVLRIFQGIAIGGELGGSILIATEHAPEGRRGLFGSFATAGGQGGTVLATGVFAVVSLMPADQLEAWGWRIPFLASAVIVLLGLLIRFGLEETPDFVETKKAEGESPAAKPMNPITYAFKNHLGTMVSITLLMSAMFVIWYILTVYSLSYATASAGVDRTTMLWVVTIATALVVVMNPVWGSLSDKIGRTHLMAAGILAEAIFLFAYMASIGTGNILLIALSLCATAGLGHAVVNGVFPAFIVDNLPPQVRYTAGSLGLQAASVLGGFGPLVAVSLETSALGIWAVPVICIVLAVLGAISAYRLTASTRATGTAPVA
ncbi:MFS transporter [Citricoccus zhacaiensis]|uniref:MFS transporter n=1 Tax=Citricoccus zhacaiensis TaxID=489142 RepID=UPI00166E0498|nr:MFS transporter [Citricoccus zhacaiensis]